MATKNKPSFGLIGIGYWGKILESKLKALGDLRFAVSGRDSQEYKDKLSTVDWVFIATPTQTHAQFTKQSLEVGTNVFCEKPFTGNHELNTQLYDLAKQRGVKLYVDDVFLWGDQLEILERQIRENGLPKKLDFVWKKKGIPKESVFYALVYHDLTILDRILGGIRKFETLGVEIGGEIKSLRTRVNGIETYFVYDLKNEGKSKQIRADGVLVYDHANQKNDALTDMISAVVRGKADYDLNQERTLRIERILEDLTRKYERGLK